MALPSQVEAAAAAADEMLAQMNAPQGEQTEDQSEAQAPQGQPESQPVLQKESDTPQPAPIDRQLEQAEQRYRTLQGMMNKEIHTLDGQVKSLTQQLEKALAKLDQPQKATQAAVDQTVTETKDVENFGSDLVEMVNRIAGAHVARAVQAVEAKFADAEKRIADLSGSVSGATQHAAMTAEQMFFDRLGKLVPDWEQINADQRFLAWLAEADPVYGVPRQAALENARDKLDANRAAAVFNTFTGPRQQAPKTDPLDKQVSPKGAASAAPTSNQKKLVSSAEITKFYDDVRRGAYRGREQQAAQLEAEFNLALSEGRVR